MGAKWAILRPAVSIWLAKLKQRKQRGSRICLPDPAGVHGRGGKTAARRACLFACPKWPWKWKELGRVCGEKGAQMRSREWATRRHCLRGATRSEFLHLILSPLRRASRAERGEGSATVEARQSERRERNSKPNDCFCNFPQLVTVCGVYFPQANLFAPLSRTHTPAASLPQATGRKRGAPTGWPPHTVCSHTQSPPAHTTRSRPARTCPLPARPLGSPARPAQDLD